MSLTPVQRAAARALLKFEPSTVYQIMDLVGGEHDAEVAALADEVVAELATEEALVAAQDAATLAAQEVDA